MTNAALLRARQVADWLAGTDIALLELDGPGISLRLRRLGEAFVEEAATAPVPASQPQICDARSEEGSVMPHPGCCGAGR